jgi:microcystin-dependent protein
MIPVGTVQPYAGGTAPTGWLLCAGQSLNASTNTQYADLWSVLGTTYGGSGITAFNLPDLRGRSPFGKDNMNGSTANRVTSGISGITATSLGAVGGDQSMQSHLHNYGSVTTSGGSVNTLGDIIWAVSGGNVVDKAGSGYLKTSTLGTNTGTGNSQNMPPTIILNYIIKY